MKAIGPIDVEEAKLLTANFSRELGTAALVSAVWNCEAVSGADPDAQLRLQGPDILEPTRARKKASGMLAGVTYNIRCVAVDSAGLKHVAATTLSATRFAV